MTKDRIQKIILEVAGKPGVGTVKEFAPLWAEAIYNELNAKVEKASEPKKENRVIESTETR